MSVEISNKLSKIGDSVIQILDAEWANSKLPSNSWQVNFLVEGSILHFNINLNYDILFKEQAYELADTFFWLTYIAIKAGGVAFRTGKLLARDNKREELIQLVDSTFVFRCNQEDNDFVGGKCKVMELTKALTEKDTDIPLQARIMSLMS